MRAGRPRKAGDRWPSGDLKRSRLAQMAADEIERLNRERVTVLAQPHRRGETSQLAESALGRFVLRHRLRVEMFEAAQHWACSKRKWLSAMGAPLRDRPGGTGADVDMEIVHQWRDEAIEGERVMRDAGGEDAFRCVERLAFDDLDVGCFDVRPIVDSLLALALAFWSGRIGRR